MDALFCKELKIYWVSELYYAIVSEEQLLSLEGGFTTKSNAIWPIILEHKVIDYSL